MPAINFSSGTTITGANGKIYLFGTSAFSIYKIEDVIIFRDTSTETWQAYKIGLFASLYALLSQSTAIESDKIFSYYFADNVLYVFVATAVDDINNRLIIKRRRHFKRTASDTAIFDVFDHHFPILIDYAEMFFAATDGRRATKETLKRIAEFEYNVSQDLEPI